MSLETIKLVSFIEPQPIFGAAHLMRVSLSSYFFELPTTDLYLKRFPLEMDVLKDFELVRRCLRGYSEPLTTFGNYRAFFERLLLWCWICKGKSILLLTKEDFQECLKFNIQPPDHWVGRGNHHRFTCKGDAWLTNDLWRPMSWRPLKALKYRAVGVQESSMYFFSESNKTQFINISSALFKFLILEGVTEINPVAVMTVRRKKFNNNKPQAGQGLSPEQWRFVLNVAKKMADQNSRYERSLFIVASYYFMYLRSSDLANGREGPPKMGLFTRHDGEWYFQIADRFMGITQIAVNLAFLPFLKRYRTSRGLTCLPYPHEDTPLLTTTRGRAGLSVRQLRCIVQEVFDRTHAEMVRMGVPETESAALTFASVAWLRDTGARLDSQHREVSDMKHDLRHVNINSTWTRYY
ncbi:hypothetical protein [Pseudomonas syringae group genomosp. 3]|nr:hypothetical protein [Pseudomonas syringae group genomosp. 3]